jgi:hypothetical protein
MEKLEATVLAKHNIVRGGDLPAVAAEKAERAERDNKDAKRVPGPAPKSANN